MAANTKKQPAYAKPANAFPKVKKSALVGPKKPESRRPKPLATKLGVTVDRKRTY